MSETEGLRAIHARLPAGPWEVWASNSFRRITGPDGKDGGVLSAYVQRSDGHPDLSMTEQQLADLCALRNALPRLLDLAQAGASRPVAVCETCNGRGEIGGFDRGDNAWRTEPCPECASRPVGGEAEDRLMRFEGQIAAHIESLRKHVERAESQFGECSYLNWIKFDASQFRSVSDTALTELRRALASRPLGDREERVAEYLYERDEARGEVEDWEVAAPECRESARAILSLLSGSEAAGDGWTFQADVDGWMQQCFGPEIAADTTERNYRFLEEALEVVQANGCTKEDALRLVDYTFSRAIGEPDQEVGGAMVCMAALCNAAGLSMVEAARRELARISEPAMMARIRAKHAAKEIRSPLPGAAPTPSGQEQGGGS